MKKLLPIILASSSLIQAEDESSQYLNFIVQTQNNDHNTQQLLNDIAPEGQGIAPKGVTGSSVFTLWTIHRTKLTEYLLDEKTVSSYHPEASIKISSLDPYEAVPRTRVDHPFTVNYTVDGLILNDPEVHDAAKSVILNHEVVSYADGKYTSEGNSLTTNNQSVIDKNGSTKESKITSVKATDLTQARGHETFTISARPDFGTDTSMLAMAKVQIWPIAQATITGFDTTKAYMSLPDLHFTLKDLYPDSTTYVRVYQGEPKANPSQTHIVNTSYVIIDDVQPVNRQYTLAGAETGITQPGNYTVEVIHETPFGSDILAQVYPLTKKAKLRVVGNLNTSE